MSQAKDFTDKVGVPENSLVKAEFIILPPSSGDIEIMQSTKVESIHLSKEDIVISLIFTVQGDQESAFNFNTKWKVQANIVDGPIKKEELESNLWYLLFPVATITCMLFSNLIREIRGNMIPIIINPSIFLNKDNCRIKWA
jgi:hypothetical protein